MSRDLSKMIKTAFSESVPSDELRVRLMNTNKPKTERKKGIVRFAAAVCAVLAMSGTVVYAVNIGRLDSLFGPSSYRIEENASDYFVQTSEFTLTEQHGEFPYILSFGDVICDGQTLFGMMNVVSKNGEPITKYSMSVYMNSFSRGQTEDFGEYGFVYLKENEDGSMDAAFYAVPENEYSSGDRISFGFAEYDVAEDLDNVSDVSYSFEIIDMPNTLANKIAVRKNAEFHTDEKTAVAMVDDLEISPFHLTVNGLCRNYRDFLTLSHATDEYSINFSDGSRFFIQNRSWKLDTENSEGRSVLEVDEEACNNYGFGGMQVDSGYSFRMDAQFRCVIPVDEIVSISVGDIEIPVE